MGLIDGQGIFITSFIPGSSLALPFPMALKLLCLPVQKLTYQLISFINKQCVPIFQLPYGGIQLCYPLLVSAQVLCMGNNVNTVTDSLQNTCLGQESLKNTHQSA